MGKKVTITVDVTELGRKGGHARAENLSPEELSAIGRVGAAKRWAKYYREHPEKRKTARPASARRREAK